MKTLYSLLLILVHLCVDGHEHDVLFLVDHSNIISQKQCIEQQTGIIAYFQEFHDMNVANVLSYYTFNQKGEISKIVGFDDEKYVDSFDVLTDKIASIACPKHRPNTNEHTPSNHSVNTHHALLSALNELNSTAYKYTKTPRILLFNNFANRTSEIEACKYFMFNHDTNTLMDTLRVTAVNFVSKSTEMPPNYLECLADNIFGFNDTSHATFMQNKKDVILSICIGGGVCTPCGSTSYYCNDPLTECSWTAAGVSNPPPGMCVPVTPVPCSYDGQCDFCMRCCSGTCVYEGDLRYDDCDGRGDCCPGDVCAAAGNGTCPKYTLVPSIFPTMDPTREPTVLAIPTPEPSRFPTMDPTVDPTDFPTMDPTTNPSQITLFPTMDPTTNPSENPTTKFPTIDPSPGPTLDPTHNPTFEPTKSPTTDPTKFPTMDPTSDPTEFPTMDPTRDPTNDPSLDPTFDPTKDPTNDPSLDPTVFPTMDPTTDPTDFPTMDPTRDPTEFPTMDPTIDPTSDPTKDPTEDPTKDPSKDPTVDPTGNPTNHPTTDPTVFPTTSEPTSDPTLDPTVDPTLDPTSDPTYDPTSDPTVDPTNDPTQDPSIDPTSDPTYDPTFDPTIDPTNDPTIDPSIDPTIDPSVDPTADPSLDPTTDPTDDPSSDPTNDPTYDPTTVPTFQPTVQPVHTPTHDPTVDPSVDPTTDPSVDPTKDPTTDPSVDPTADPTNDPSSDPTNDPTTDPTSDPTTAPTLAPTLNPTLAPTLYPTLAPSLAPTSPPTIAPSLAPTLTPTLAPTAPPTLAPSRAPTTPPTAAPTTPSPTFSPSLTPTLAPTSPPTSAPSFSPTLSPTRAPSRYPTEEKEYRHVFEITYLIQYLETEYIEILVNRKLVRHVLEDMVELIERAYLEVTDLKYRFFGLYVQRLLGYKINKIESEMYYEFVNAAADGITLECKIQCDEHSCEMLQDLAFRDEFEALGTQKLRKYFTEYEQSSKGRRPRNANAEVSEESQLIFMIATYGAYTELYSPETMTAAQSITDNKILIALLSVFVVSVITSLLALRYSKRTEIDSIWFAPTIFGLQMAVFTCDINLCVAIFSNASFGNDLKITMCGVCCTVFLIAPYYANTYFGGKLRRLLPKENESAVAFFSQRQTMFIILRLISGGCWPVIVLLSSNIFALKACNSGLTNYELKKLKKIKVIGTCLLENIPMIIIVCVYSTVSKAITLDMTSVFIFSILSIVTTPVTVRHVNQKYFNYYIQIQMKHMHETDTSEYFDEMHMEFEENVMGKFETHKGKTQQIRQIFCDVLEFKRSDIEISRNPTINVRQTMLELYVKHFVSTDMDLDEIGKLYSAKYAVLKERFRNHFRFYDEETAMTVTFKSGDGYDIEIDELAIQTEIERAQLAKEQKAMENTLQKHSLLNKMFSVDSNVTYQLSSRGDDIHIELQPVQGNITAAFSLSATNDEFNPL